MQLTPDDKLIQSMALRGNSRITGGAGASGAQGMSARDIDLTYAPDGRTLQQSNLVENAVVADGRRTPASAQGVAARVIDLTMGPDGSTSPVSTPIENVQLDLPGSRGRTGAAHHLGDARSPAGPNGLQTATFAGGVCLPRAAGRRGAADRRRPSARRARSG